MGTKVAMLGARITDEVILHQRRGNDRAAVRVVCSRGPDKFRWRSAVSELTKAAGSLQGLPRLRIEEPIREAVLDIGTRPLQREVILDARRFNVDLDRGEVLPVRRVLDLRRYCYIMDTDLNLIRHYLTIPEDYRAPIDTGGVGLVGRALANHYRRRAQRIWLDLPQEGSEAYTEHHHHLALRAERDADLARRWGALAREVLGEPPPPPTTMGTVVPLPREEQNGRR